jgi:hypothetical protein
MGRLETQKAGLTKVLGECVGEVPAIHASLGRIGDLRRCLARRGGEQSLEISDDFGAGAASSAMMKSRRSSSEASRLFSPTW